MNTVHHPTDRPSRATRRLAAATAVVAGVLVLAGCLTTPPSSAGRSLTITAGVGGTVDPDGGAVVTAHPAAGVAQPGGTTLSDRQERILRAADELLRSQNFLVSGYRYNEDCTGTVLAIYAMAGLHLVDLFPRYTGNGVQRLYAMAEEHDLLYHSDYPQTGDLIFWDNTYDRNGDGRWNDPLTHVGLVLAVDSGGRIEYLHHDYSQGAVRAQMNLTDPSTHVDARGVVVNSPMRMRSHRHLNPDAWLASHLYRQLGAMHEIRL